MHTEMRQNLKHEPNFDAGEVIGAKRILILPIFPFRPWTKFCLHICVTDRL